MKPYELLPALKNHFQSDSTLSYISQVVIEKFSKDRVPLIDDENYGIVISPKNRRVNLLTAQQEQITFAVDIICIVRNFDPEKSITGYLSNETGILKMVEDIALSLFNFGEEYHENGLTILWDEMNNPVDFSISRNTERADFYHEHILPYTVRLKPYNLKNRG